MRLKKILLLLLIAISAISFTGCIKSTQLNERALVQAVGVDLEDDMIKLTLQIFSPAATGGAISATAQNANIIETTGKTISEAVQNATLVQGKQPFMGHCRLIVVGSDLAKQGLKQPLSFFNSNIDARQSISIVVAKQKANDILKAKINQGILPAETLEKIIENTKENGMLEDIKMFEFLKSLQSKHESTILPMIEMVEKKEKSSKPNSEAQSVGSERQSASEQSPEKENINDISPIKVGGMALFVDSKMVGELDSSETRGILWIRDKIDNTTVITSTDKYDVAALRIYKAKSKLIPHIVNNGNISFTLDVNCEATLGEAMVKKGETVELKDIKAIEDACSTQIIKECSDAFRTSVYKYNADVFDLGNIVWRKYPETWKLLKDNWPENITNITLDVQCKVIINRVGLEFNQE